MKSAQTNIKRPGGLLGCVLSRHSTLSVSRVCLSRVFVVYWRDGAAANGKNAYSYLAVMRLNCLKYLDRSFGSVDTSQGSRLNQVFTFQTVVARGRCRGNPRQLYIY